MRAGPREGDRGWHPNVRSVKGGRGCSAKRWLLMKVVWVKRGEAVGMQKLATNALERRGRLEGKVAERGAHGKGEKRGNPRGGEPTGREHRLREMEWKVV
ncbi:hypothetical protein OIU78_019833 [Salix suchowensis]|nr:hypothetical protein OIU78_019833 [Salix suchowensis]